MNGYGQIVGQWFLPTNSNTELKGVLKLVAKRFKDRNLGSAVYVWVDNCCNVDRAMYEQCFETLQPQGIEVHVDAALKFGQAGKGASLSKLGYGKSYAPKYITTVDEANIAARKLSESTDEGDVEIGLDAEYELPTTTPPGMSNGLGHPLKGQADSGWVDVLQLATETEVYVFHLSQMQGSRTKQHHLPNELINLLENNSKLFVGRNIKSDLTRLGNHFHRNKDHFKGINFADIATKAQASAKGDKFNGNDKLGDLCRELLDLDLDKGVGERTSNWRHGNQGTGKLTLEQKTYAAVDAAVHLAVYKKACALPPLPLKAGVACKLYDHSKSTIVATGNVTSVGDEKVILEVRPADIQCVSATFPARTVAQRHRTRRRSKSW
jgi:hypothetical protein